MQTTRETAGVFPDLEERETFSSDFDAIKISIASPEKIRAWSHGEVTKAETINYRTLKPERGGLFCAQIFGPISDWECLCGKYKRMKHRGVVCDKCGVEVTQASVRRSRLGHIELACPVSHVWFFKVPPSRIGQVLDLTPRELERILYYESYVVLDPGDVDIALLREKEVTLTLEEVQLLQQLFAFSFDERDEGCTVGNIRLGSLRKGQVVTEDQDRLLKRLFGRTDNEFREKLKRPGSTYRAGMGAGAAKQLLHEADLETLAVELRHAMRHERSIQKRTKAAKRLKVVDAFRKSGNLPEWMIMDVIPVIPPDLRPLVPLDGGRFATSDLNELYRKVINRNNRLRRLLELRAPDVIVRNEQRMLQEAVDALFDNGRRGRVLKGTNNRPLKSLSDTLKGKQGRFRQNLLGKRVDYSGRSVIVVGPELKVHQCGLPKKMALELFKPFLFNRLEHEGLAATIKQARELVEEQRPEVWDYLEEVISEHSVLLNRAPTLHRLGIQAFEPVLVEGKAIRIHPLVCSAFNADFDGDQMAVHVPLSPEAQVEASLLMRSSRNILSPAHGGPLAVPTQDMVLGIYYLTKPQVTPPEEKQAFSSIEEVLLAHESGQIATLTPIQLRYSGELLETHDSQDLLRVKVSDSEGRRIETTVGRVLLNDRLPADLPFVNGVLKKKGIQSLVRLVYLRHGLESTADVLDALKDIGFEYATRSGTSIGLGDLVVPPNKARLVEEAKEEVGRVDEQYQQGAITHGERYNKVIDVWSNATNKVAEDMLKTMQVRERETGRFSPVFMMVDSGARGSEKQIRQLAGMRGLMAKTSGEIIETPITSNFREGLSVIQYFISTNGARKGLADTALRTADAGYLTRRLADVAQDVIVTHVDCGTLRGIYAEPIIEAGEVIEPLRDRIVGRVSLEAVKDFRGDLIVDAGEEISEEIATAIEGSGVARVKIRSVLTCDARRGVCAMCYGRNLATGRLVDLGEAVGIIAAQSIGEPGTQLTMRTFHIGGTASVFENSALEARHDGVMQFSENLRTVEDRHGNLVVINRAGTVEVGDGEGRVLESHPVVYGARIKAAPGSAVSSGQVIVEWDPYSFSILAEEEGTVRFRDIIADVTMIQEVDNVTFRSQAVIIESPDDRFEPRIEIQGAPGEDPRTYLMPSRAHLEVEEDDAVRPGDVLAKIPRETTKTKDITGGLPRVVELFEARPPKAPALISEIDGRLQYGDVRKGKRVISVTSQVTDDVREYEVPRGVHISVRENEEVRAGDPLMDGPRNPHDILRVLGEGELQRYLVHEIQEVYRLQGVVIDDKHIEVIISRMMRWVRVTDVGDTDLIVDSTVDRHEFAQANRKAQAEGGQAAQGEPMLLGLTKASLATDSFISAASFQETTKVLTEASLTGKVDYLRGLKENVIMGRLIPAGTGLREHRRFVLPEEIDAHRQAMLQEDPNPETELAEEIH
ncbi:MAG: DNA-directed RNA polymerase subunit beta' [Acidobacteria bacterium]|nr:DNA-directed RNA polymerase subunit beta' [Acidobacteriota bacterium]